MDLTEAKKELHQTDYYKRCQNLNYGGSKLNKNNYTELRKTRNKLAWCRDELNEG